MKQVLCLVGLALSLSAYANAQDVSNGDTSLPNKAVANLVYPDCVVVDSMHTFFNLRNSQCDLFPTFRNGEKRFLQKDVDGVILPDNESITVDAFGETACSSSNGTWIRNFAAAEDLLSWFVSWDLTWFPRKSDNMLDIANKKEFHWKKCRVFKTIATTDCVIFDGGRCDTGAPKTPIVIDLNDDGVVELTDKANGISFDVDSNGEKEQRPWLANGDDGWLVFVQRLDEQITNGSMLFGPGDKNNGYLHLAGFDDNGDGLISNIDGIWPSLAVWRDYNHNGLSEQGELLYLTHSQINWLSLDFKESRRKDRHGNEFRYRSTMGFADGRIGRTFDVILP